MTSDAAWHEESYMEGYVCGLEDGKRTWKAIRFMQAFDMSEPATEQRIAAHLLELSELDVMSAEDRVAFRAAGQALRRLNSWWPKHQKNLRRRRYKLRRAVG